MEQFNSSSAKVLMQSGAVLRCEVGTQEPSGGQLGWYAVLEAKGGKEG